MDWWPPAHAPSFPPSLLPSQVTILCWITYFWRWRIHLGKTEVVEIKIEGPLLCTGDAAPRCSLTFSSAFVHFFALWLNMNNHLVPSCCTAVSSETQMGSSPLSLIYINFYLYSSLIYLHTNACVCAHARSQCSGAWPSALNYWKGNCM